VVLAEVVLQLQLMLLCRVAVVAAVLSTSNQVVLLGIRQRQSHPKAFPEELSQVSPARLIMLAVAAVLVRQEAIPMAGGVMAYLTLSWVLRRSMQVVARVVKIWVHHREVRVAVVKEGEAQGFLHQMLERMVLAVVAVAVLLSLLRFQGLRADPALLLFVIRFD
jgi:hypothetical protein